MRIATVLFFTTFYLSVHPITCSADPITENKITWTRTLKGILYKPKEEILSFSIDSHCKGTQGSLQLEAVPTTSVEKRYPPHQCTLTFPLGDKDCLLKSMGTWVGVAVDSPVNPRIAVFPCRISQEYKIYLTTWWKGTWNKEVPGLLFKGFQVTPDPVRNSVRITFDQNSDIDSFVLSFLK